VPAFVLLVLKYVFLALLYFFIYRAIRAVVVDVHGGRPRRQRTTETKPARAVRQRARGGGKPPAVVIVRREDGKKVSAHKLTSAMQIGRAEACHIRPDDTYVSQFHARLYSKNGAWYVEDLGSTNGTYLNRQRLTAPAEVVAGDQVRVGKTVLDLRR
jgi:FHA domain